MAAKKSLPTVERLELLFGSWESVKRHFNIVLLGDGYTKAELVDFAAHARELANAIVAAAPFDRMRSAINIFRMDIASVDSWNSAMLAQWRRQHDEAAVAEPDVNKRRQMMRDLYCNMPATNTALGVRFCHQNEPRTAFGDEEVAAAVARSDPQLKQVHGVVVIVNTDKFDGGSGGKVAWASRRHTFIQTALHELGHQGFGLADEYHYEHKESEHAPFTGAEPQALNVSTSAHPDFAPWARLLTAGVPLPTSTAHAGCPQLTTAAQLRDGTFGVPPAHVASVGAFEGALHRLCGVFRPALNCKMRVMSHDFCPVCQQVMVEKLGTHLFGNARTQGERPIDSGTHLITFLPDAVTSDATFMIYNFGTGAYAIYTCAPFTNSLLTPKPSRGTIAPFWTSITSVYYKNEPHVLAIQLGSGAFALYRFSEDGSSLSFVRGTVAPGFGVPFPFGLIQVVRFPFLNDLHYLEYDIVTGRATVKRIESATPDPVTIRTLALGSGRIGFTPFTLQNDSSVHFYSYDITTGAVELHRLDVDDVTSVWSSPTLLAGGWSDLVPFRLNDDTRFLLLHSRLSGILRVFRIRSDGKGLEYVYTDRHAGRGPFTFAAFRLLQDKRTYYLRYRWPLVPGQQATIEAFHCD